MAAGGGGGWAVALRVVGGDRVDACLCGRVEGELLERTFRCGAAHVHYVTAAVRTQMRVRLMDELDGAENGPK